jgi:hypothetical protein
MRHIFGMVNMFLVASSLLNYGLEIATATAAPPVKEDAHSGVTQNWDKNLPSNSRFSVLASFGGTAVRDNNTGLVWEQSPNSGLLDWDAARPYCISKIVGGTVGWRLPSAVELKSIQDPSLVSPFVPTSIFTGVGPVTFWSASTSSQLSTDAWRVDFNVGLVNTTGKGNSFYVWCVRGPMQESVY